MFLIQSVSLGKMKESKKLKLLVLHINVLNQVCLERYDAIDNFEIIETFLPLLYTGKSNTFALNLGVILIYSFRDAFSFCRAI